MSYSQEPRRSRYVKRAVGDYVWVQAIEQDSEEWFQCEVAEFQRNPNRSSIEYRVKPVDSVAPGELYESGIWLLPNRLCDENDREFGQSCSSPTTKTHKSGEDQSGRKQILGSVDDEKPDLQLSDRGSENETEIHQDKPGDDSVTSAHKESAGGSSYGTTSLANYNTALDERSVYPDANEQTVSKPVRSMLSTLVADDIRKNLGESVLASISTQDYVAAVVSGYIFGFAVLIVAGLVKPQSEIQRRATACVRQLRDDIANHLTQKNGGSKLKVAEQPSREHATHSQDSEGAGTPEVGELREPLGGPPESYSGPGLGLDPLTLTNVPEAEKYLTRSPHFYWLLERIRSLASLTQTGDAFSSTHTAIMKALRDNLGCLTLTFDWDPRTTLVGQYHYGSLSNMIVYNGSASTCYATTTLEYTRLLWPQSSEGTLGCFEEALSSSNHAASASFRGLNFDIRIQMGMTTVELSADTLGGFQSWTALVEAAEICVWLAAACREYAHGDTVGLSSLEIQQDNSQRGLHLTPSITAIQNKTKRQGQCWVDMVRNPVIAVGYPVPARPKDLQGKGLELHIDLLVALSRVNWFTEVERTIVFKGSISALVAVAESNGALCWHLLVNTDGNLMTYEQTRLVETDNELLPITMTLPEVKRRRHFVGMWATEALVHVGTSDVSYHARPSQVRHSESYTASFSNLAVGISKVGSVNFGFSLQSKDLGLKFAEEQVYGRQVANAAEMTILFYSSSDRRAWMVDGASAVVHLARAWLESPSAKCKRDDVLPALRYIEGNGGCDAAMKVLMGTNRTLIIFDDATTNLERRYDDDYDDSLGDKRFTRTGSAFSYENLVVELIGKLKGLQAKLKDAKKGFLNLSIPSDPHLLGPGPIITGWDSDNLFSADFKPRRRVLKAGSKGWVEYVEDVSSVVLMAYDFGDLITPSRNWFSGNYLDSLPKGKDMLAVPARVLEMTMRQPSSYGKSSRASVRISGSHFLYTFDGLASKCECGDHSQCRLISEICDKYKKDPLGIDAANGSVATSIFGEDLDAALMIGKRAQFCGK